MSDDHTWAGRFVTALTAHAAAVPRPPIRVAATLQPAAPGPAGELVTPALLARLGGRTPSEWAPVLNAACAAHGIDTPAQLAAFLANVLTETGSLSHLSESLDYTPAALLRVWPSHFTAATAQRLGRTPAHAADQQAIAAAAYDGRNGNRMPGDGWAFRGGGCLQTTGRANFAALASAVAWTSTLEDLATYVRTPVGGATSAACFWQAHALNAPADRRDLEACRRIVNGGLNGLADCQAHYTAACAALGVK